MSHGKHVIITLYFVYFKQVIILEMLVKCYGGHRGLTELLVYIDVFTPFFKINKAGKSYILGSGILSFFMIHT